MRAMRQIFTGLGVGLLSLVVTMGALALSLTEGNLTAPLPPTSTFTPPPPGLTPITFTPPPPTSTFTLPPPPTSCPPPAGWVAYVVQAGDTLEDLASRYRIGMETLSQANCLLTVSLLPGSVLYVPPAPTRTPIPCGPPQGWVTYTVQRDDTLYHLSLAYGVTVRQLQNANCMGNSTLILTGQKLFVPPGPTRTPPASATPTFTRTPTQSLSAVSSSTGTFTPTTTPTATASNTPENTPTPTWTFTETSAKTP